MMTLFTGIIAGALVLIFLALCVLSDVEKRSLALQEKSDLRAERAWAERAAREAEGLAFGEESQRIQREQNALMAALQAQQSEALTKQEAWRVEERAHMAVCEKRYRARLEGQDVGAVKH